MKYHEELRQLNDVITRFAYAINQNNKAPHQYLPKVRLYPTEIHLIEMVGNHDDMNITALATRYGSTKGAISRQVSKLQRKGLLEKYQINGNKKEVWVRLTELGQKAYAAHDRFHANQRSRYIEDYMTYTPQEKALVLRFLDLYAQSLYEYNYKENLRPEEDV